jgi:F-type H+-transporting ATPase subunit epsilon
MPEHALLITGLRPGVLTTRSTSGEEKKYYLRGGFADVGPKETVVLAEFALPLEDLTPALFADEMAQAQEAFDRAIGEEQRYSAQDRLERMQSLKTQLHV